MLIYPRSTEFSATILDDAFASFRNYLDQFDPTEDIPALEGVRDAAIMWRLIDGLGIPDSVAQILGPLHRHLEGLVDCVSYLSKQETRVRVHAWGSIYLLCWVG